MKYIILLITILNSQIPKQFSFDNNSLYRYESISEENISDNSIIDIRKIDDEYILLSTGNGLSYVKKNNNISTDSVTFGQFNKNLVSLPRGGVPALITDENIIAVSGLVDTMVASVEERKGTGISYSIDYGETWEYLQQPIDDIPEEGRYHLIEWANQDSIAALAVTTEINNISYDLAVSNNYIYAASWAGGLRRFGPLNDEIRAWEIIPLPMDNDSTLLCNEINKETYELNPNDPINGGNHNHKGFSVYAIEDTIWMGSANGINKGVLNDDCIDWTDHFKSQWDNISGNWVIGFTHQNLENQITRLWAITWVGDGGNENHGLSYTDDGGKTWKNTQPSGKSEKVYNIYSNSDYIWATLESGLYISNNGKYWEKYSRIVDNVSGEEFFSQASLSFFQDTDEWFWLGTPDGIAISDNDGLDWTIHRYWEKTYLFDDKNILSVYPNPFLINTDIKVRFVYYYDKMLSSKLDVFDFAMDHVRNLNNTNIVNSIGEKEIIWDGLDEYGNPVANGIYFCRLSIDGKYYWTKLSVIN